MFDSENGFFMLIGGVVVAVVLGQSIFFLIKAYRRALALGIERATLRGTIVSSALFTIAPSLAIVATVLALANALGIILPWIRLSVIGNITYETTAAEAALKSAQPELMRAAGKGVMHANTASRKVSRLAHRVKTLSA